MVALDTKHIEIENGNRGRDWEKKGRVERWRGGLGFELLLFQGFPTSVPSFRL